MSSPMNSSSVWKRLRTVTADPLAGRGPNGMARPGSFGGRRSRSGASSNARMKLRNGTSS